jgi:prevent-host-death family protein
MLDQHTNIMKTVSIHEAKANLSRLVADVEKCGERVLLSRYGRPVVELVPAQPSKRTTPHAHLRKIRYRGDLTDDTCSEWEDV